MPGRARRVRLRGPALALAALLLALLTAEGALRFLVFSDGDFARRYGWRIRHAWAFTSRVSGRDYFALRAELSGPVAARSAPFPDPLLGWRDAEFASDFSHRGEGSLAGRRPVLLFGDSYARCVTPPEDCWQGLLEASDLSGQYRLLNYGSGGYGLDQIYLLLERSIDRFRERDPIVVVGIVVDDDLDRTYLALREYPKPWFSVEGERLVYHPPEGSSAREYLERHPLDIRSYLWRWLLHGARVFGDRASVAWTDEADHVEVKQEICRRLVIEIQRELEERGLRYFFVLFHGPEALESRGSYSWQEPFLQALLRERRIPYVSSRRWLLADAARTASDPRDYYYQSMPRYGHYTPAANRAVFECLRRGLAGEFEPWEETDDD
jgi:hypothetical protein